jgi:hypothetical protein
MLNGPVVLASPLVYQSLAGGTLGTIYEVKCAATTTGITPTQIINITAFLAVLPDLV